MSEKPIILLVDDEEAILSSLKRLLRKEGYSIVTSQSGEEALELVNDFSFALVVADQKMQGMEGGEFLQKFKETSPDTIRVILSGYVDPAMVVESINQGEIYRFFAKPWDDETLKAGIRQCVEHYQLQSENKRLLSQIKEQNATLVDMNEQLEELVASRTHSLTLSQEIVDMLPVSVLCVDDNLDIMICNKTAIQALHLDGGFMPGENCADFFSENMQNALRSCLECEERSVHKEHSFNGSDIDFSCLLCPLPRSPSRGVLVLIEEVHIGNKS